MRRSKRSEARPARLARVAALVASRAASTLAMRRRAGVSAIKHANELDDKFRRLGVERARFREEETQKQLQKFTSQLERFAASHRDGIRADPELRAAFHAMCASVGVDPLASRKSAWGQILGLGDFYVELAVGVADCCLASRAQDGGLCELSALVDRVNRRRSSAVGQVSADDVERAIGALATLGGGWRVESTGTASKSNGDSARRPNGAVKMVRSVPMELSDDVNAALAFAKDTPEGTRDDGGARGIARVVARSRRGRARSRREARRRARGRSEQRSRSRAFILVSSVPRGFVRGMMIRREPSRRFVALTDVALTARAQPFLDASVGRHGRPAAANGSFSKVTATLVR